MDGNEPFLFQDARRPKPKPPAVPPVVPLPRVPSGPVSGHIPPQRETATHGSTLGSERARESPGPHSRVNGNARTVTDGVETARDTEVEENRGPTSYTKLGYTEFQRLCTDEYAKIINDIDATLDREEREEERKRTERKEAQAKIAETLARNPNLSRAPKRISFLPLVERVKIRAEQIKSERDNNCFIPRISASYADPRYNERPSDGETVYKRLLECFISFKDQPTPFQHKLFTAVASACAPLIFGEEFFSDPARCLQIIGGRFTDGLVGILTGRKTGKSTGLAYIAICLMFVIRRFKAIIVSKTLEQAKIILDTVKGLLQSHPWWASGGYKVIESRATALVIQGPDGSLRVLEARCGSGEVRVDFSLLFFGCVGTECGRACGGDKIFFPLWISRIGGALHCVTLFSPHFISPLSPLLCCCLRSAVCLAPSSFTAPPAETYLFTICHATLLPAPSAEGASVGRQQCAPTESQSLVRRPSVSNVVLSIQPHCNLEKIRVVARKSFSSCGASL